MERKHLAYKNYVFEKLSHGMENDKFSYVMMIVLFSADNVSLYDELANSIEEQEEDPFPLPLPELGGHTESAKIHLKLTIM